MMEPKHQGTSRDVRQEWAEQTECESVSDSNKCKSLEVQQQVDKSSQH